MTPRFKTSGPFLIAGIIVAAWLFASHFFEERQDSALLGAIIAGDVSRAQQAFKDGATMTMPIRRHVTFLQVAASQGNVEMAKLLVEHGALATLASTNDEGKTALDSALAAHHRELADYLRSLPATNRSQNLP